MSVNVILLFSSYRIMSRVWVALIYQICRPLSVCDISPKLTTMMIARRNSF